MAESTDNPTVEEIRAQAAAIVASGLLGRSRFYRALLEYLVESAERGRAPKEVEIAADVFQRGERFDPSQDSMVRVYVHNLRQKLEQYYRQSGAGHARWLAIPKGEYRVVLVEPEAAPAGAAAESAAARRGGIVAGLPGAALLVAAGLIAGVVLAVLFRNAESALMREYRSVAASPLWSRMLDDDRPVTVVVGDYFIFGELDERGDVTRLVREFEINSPRDLDGVMIESPAMAKRYLDLELTYLPSSAATAVGDFLRVIYTTDKTVRVVAMSDLDAMDIRDDHIIYVGYLSGLDKLIDFVFRASELAIGSTYDELIDMVTGESFHSEAGIPSDQRNYRDYSLVSIFPGPNGNEFMILAGTRDEGLMQSARAVSDAASVESSLAAVAEDIGELPAAFEVLYEVAGFGRTNLDAQIVHIAELSPETIWTGEISLPD